MFGLTLQPHDPKGIPATYKDTHTYRERERERGRELATAQSQPKTYPKTHNHTMRLKSLNKRIKPHTHVHIHTSTSGPGGLRQAHDAENLIHFLLFFFSLGLIKQYAADLLCSL